MMGNRSLITADQVQTENKIIPHTPAQRVDVQAEYKAVIIDYQDLKEIAGGSIASVFGADYKEIDSYRRCVRLPMEPYLLVSRVTQIEGKHHNF